MPRMLLEVVNDKPLMAVLVDRDARPTTFYLISGDQVLYPDELARCCGRARMTIYRAIERRQLRSRRVTDKRNGRVTSGIPLADALAYIAAHPFPVRRASLPNPER